MKGLARRGAFPAAGCRRRGARRRMVMRRVVAAALAAGLRRCRHRSRSAGARRRRLIFTAHRSPTTRLRCLATEELTAMEEPAHAWACRHGGAHMGGGRLREGRSKRRLKASRQLLGFVYPSIARSRRCFYIAFIYTFLSPNFEAYEMGKRVLPVVSSLSSFSSLFPSHTQQQRTGAVISSGGKQKHQRPEIETGKIETTKLI
ncbi:hypothetical protein Dimus_024136 [Dionaea muscipula]